MAMYDPNMVSWLWPYKASRVAPERYNGARAAATVEPHIRATHCVCDSLARRSEPPGMIEANLPTLAPRMTGRK